MWLCEYAPYNVISLNTYKYILVNLRSFEKLPYFSVINKSLILLLFYFFISYAAHFFSPSLFLPFSLFQVLRTGPPRDDSGPVKGTF